MSGDDFVIGIVKWFNPIKGYGFVIHDGKDVFIHSKKLRQSGLVATKDAPITLYPDDKLKFKIETGPKGSFAIEISKVELTELQLTKCVVTNVEPKK